MLQWKTGYNSCGYGIPFALVAMCHLSIIVPTHLLLQLVERKLPLWIQFLFLLFIQKTLKGTDGSIKTCSLWFVETLVLWISLSLQSIWNTYNKHINTNYISYHLYNFHGESIDFNKLTIYGFEVLHIMLIFITGITSRPYKWFCC